MSSIKDKRKNVSPFAKHRIDEYTDIVDKNRVCINCGFENTNNVDNEYSLCFICNLKYKLIPLKDSSVCCIIS